MLGTQEVFFAVIATTLTLAAVFIPISFLPGQTGRLFREFGFTLAMAVGLSAVVALTLAPMLASRLLKHAADGPHRNPLARFGRLLGALLSRGCCVLPRYAAGGDRRRRAVCRLGLSSFSAACARN